MLTWLIEMPDGSPEGPFGLRFHAVARPLIRAIDPYNHADDGADDDEHPPTKVAERSGDQPSLRARDEPEKTGTAQQSATRTGTAD